MLAYRVVPWKHLSWTEKLVERFTMLTRMERGGDRCWMAGIGRAPR